MKILLCAIASFILFHHPEPKPGEPTKVMGLSLMDKLLDYILQTVDIPK